MANYKDKFETNTDPQQLEVLSEFIKKAIHDYLLGKYDYQCLAVFIAEAFLLDGWIKSS